MSATSSGTIEIDRSRERVWAQLFDLDSLVTWYDDWDACEHDPGGTVLRVGLTFTLRSHRRLRRVAECHVITVEPPTLLRWIEHRPLRPPVLVEFQLAAPTSTTTTVTLAKTPGRIRLMP